VFSFAKQVILQCQNLLKGGLGENFSLEKFSPKVFL